jgi:hypothetical protein
MESERESSELASLAQILKRGLAACEILVPYFGGMDWNPENIMLDGATAIVVDGFAQEGWIITDRSPKACR